MVNPVCGAVSRTNGSKTPRSAGWTYPQRGGSGRISTVPKSERTRARILDAAAKVFRERGFAGTRLSDVADQADLQAPSLYYHFENKENLMEEVLRLGVERTFIRVQRAVEDAKDGDALIRLRNAVAAHLAAVVEIGNYAAVNIRMLGEMPPEIFDRHRALQRRVGRFWHGLLEDAQLEGGIRGDLDLHAARMLILGALNWVPEWYSPRGLSVDELTDQALSLFFDGLGTATPTAEVANAPAPDVRSSQ
jgi:AcrR family transcriptional regulator